MCVGDKDVRVSLCQSCVDSLSALTIHKYYFLLIELSTCVEAAYHIWWQRCFVDLGETYTNIG